MALKTFGCAVNGLVTRLGHSFSVVRFGFGFEWADGRELPFSSFSLSLLILVVVVAILSLFSRLLFPLPLLSSNALSSN